MILGLSIALGLVLVWAIAATWQRDNAKSKLSFAEIEIFSLESSVNSLRADLTAERKDTDALSASMKLERQRADANYEAGKTAKKDLEDALFKLRMVRRALDHDGNPLIYQTTQDDRINHGA